MKIAKTCLWVLVLALVFQVPAFAQLVPDRPLITVSGDAEVRVVPDEVIITVGVETWNQDLAVAKSENDVSTKKVIDAAKKLGVEEKHIQTDHISVEPRYKDQWEHRAFVGFFVRKTVAVTLRDVAKFETLLSDLLGAGANYVHGVDFRTTDLRKHRDEARALAIKAAKEKAEALAGELGRFIGKPFAINEGYAGWYSGYGSRWGSRWGGMMAQNVVQNAVSDGSSDGSVALGQINVTAKVTVSFELE